MTASPSRQAAGIFFASGFAALTYQIVWQRALFAIFGINVEAVTVVVAGFLAGLGIGSLLGGWLSRHTRIDLLRVFVALELTVGMFGAVSLPIFEWAGRQVLHRPEPIVAATVLVLLILPTLAMGATLPILAQHLVRSSGAVGDSVGLLYCLNTLGSAVACFVAMLGLMRAFGMQGVTLVAACLNFAVAGAALWISRSVRPHSAPTRREPAPARRITGALLMAILTGYLALSWEIVWFRAFLVHRDRATAFALLLGTYLAGLAIGSYRVRGFRSAAGAARSTLGQLLLESAGFAFLVLPAAAYAAPLGWFEFVMAVLVLAQAIVAGGIFPLLCEIGVEPGEHTGAGLGILYLGNIAGSVLGTLVTGLALLNVFSTPTLNVILAVAGLALAAAYAPRVRLAAILAAGAIAAGSFGGFWFPQFYERLIYGPGWRSRAPFTHIVENRHGVIAVNRDGVVYGGGLYDGMVRIDLAQDPNLLIRPLSLPLFHPSPREVLVIGLSTGAWAQILTRNPGIEHITAVEINPGYEQLIRQYPEVQSLLANPKFELVTDDGRRWMTRHPERRFDAIVQNTTWNYRSNATNLLSREYLRLTVAHLEPGGIVMFNATGSDRALHTGCAELPNGFREYNLFVGSPAVLRPDFERLRAALTVEGVPDVEKKVAATMGSLENCTSVLRRTGDLREITDDNMGEEWRPLDRDSRYDRFLLNLATLWKRETRWTTLSRAW
jgi:spermidine synthase